MLLRSNPIWLYKVLGLILGSEFRSSFDKTQFSITNRSPSVVFNEISMQIGAASNPWPETWAWLSTFLASWEISALSLIAKLNQLWLLGLGWDSVRDFPPCLDWMMICDVLKNMCLTYFSNSLNEVLRDGAGEDMILKKGQKRAWLGCVDSTVMILFNVTIKMHFNFIFGMLV